MTHSPHLHGFVFAILLALSPPRARSISSILIVLGAQELLLHVAPIVRRLQAATCERVPRSLDLHLGGGVSDEGVSHLRDGGVEQPALERRPAGFEGRCEVGHARPAHAPVAASQLSEQLRPAPLRVAPEAEHLAVLARWLQIGCSESAPLTVWQPHLPSLGIGKISKRDANLAVEVGTRRQP